MKKRIAPFITDLNQITNLTANVVQDGAGRDIYRASVKVPGPSFLRLNIGCPKAKVYDGLERLEKVFSILNKPLEKV